MAFGSILGQTPVIPEGVQITFGSYVGNGAASRKIDLGFTPSAVFSMLQTGNMSSFWSGYQERYGGLALPGKPVTTNWGPNASNKKALEIVDGGFNVFYNYDNEIFTNREDYSYVYIAYH